jgi:predicted DNA-binding transcriptional regulator AlpA
MNQHTQERTAGSSPAGRVYRHGKLAEACRDAMGGERRDAPHDDRPAAPPPQTHAVPAALLLTTPEAAALLGVPLRTFQRLRAAEWMPKPRVLSKMVVRWARSELEAAIAAIPQQETPAAPLQLAKARALKSATTVSGVAS